MRPRASEHRIRLSGRLVCASPDEADIVRAHLPKHVELTRAETGCLTFSVTPTDDPLVWSVEEEFSDRVAFASHQQRVAESAWGRATASIERRYSVSGLTPSAPAGPS